MPFIQYQNSLSIYYNHNSFEHKNSIVFVHGNSCSSVTWEGAHRSSLSNQYNLVSLDLPGHGKSSRASSADIYTIQGLTDCLIYVIQSLRLPSFILVGHSLGGHLIIEAANKLKDCKGLMIMGSPPVNIPIPEDIFVGDPKIIGYSFTSELNFEQAKVLARSRAMTLEDLGPLVSDILNTDGAFREIILSTASGPRGISDEKEIVENLKIPIAILHGNSNEIANIKYIEPLNISSLWKGIIHIVNKSGHTIPMEQPEAFLSLLRGFADDVFC